MWEKKIRPIAINTDILYAADVEVYPNFFCVTFVNCKDESDTKSFVIFEDRNDRAGLVKFLNTPDLVLATYNGIHYDNIIINYILQNEDATCKKIFNLSKATVEKSEKHQDKVKKLKYWEPPYKSLDLMKIKAFDKLGVSLKMVAIGLKWHKLQDLPIHWTEHIKEEDIKLILEYNLNDTLITVELFKYIRDEIILRQNIVQMYGVDVYNASDTAMAKALLNNTYSKETGLTYYEFKDLRTYRNSVKLSDCISPKIHFKTDALQVVLEEIRQQEVEAIVNDAGKYKFKYARPVEFGGKVYDIMMGGLHSRDEPGVFEADDEFEIIDADVDSFYPSIMINDRVKPVHLDDKFFDILRRLRDDRLEAKKLAKKGDSKAKVRQAALKLSINSIYGFLSSEFYWLYDPLSLLRVTVSGQLYLLMLIERLYLEGIEMVSANTDGVLAKVHVNQKQIYEQVCNEWAEETGFSLSYANFDGVYRRDVNNYVAIKNKRKRKDEDNVKEKGVFETSLIWDEEEDDLEERRDLKKGMKRPIIVSKALREYFINGKEISKVVKNPRNSIYDYLISEKSKSKFKTYYLYIDEKGEKQVELQKNNRFYVSKRGGIVLKKDPNDPKDKVTRILANQTVRLLNDVDNSQKLSQFEIDYDYYIAQVEKIIDQITPKLVQGSLF